MANAITSNAVRRRMLGLSLHDWETVMIGALAVAGIAAVIVGVSTYCVVQLQRHESASSKRDMVALELETEQAKTATAKAHERIAELNNETELLRQSNLELEKAFSPRSVRFTGADANKLRDFGPVRWALAVVPRDEPHDTANQIGFLLDQAKWKKFDGPLPAAVGPLDGVTIYLSDERARAAAEALAVVLNASGIETAVQYGGRWRLKAIAPDGIRIEIGRKPSLAITRARKDAQAEWEHRRLEETQKRLPNVETLPRKADK